VYAGHGVPAQVLDYDQLSRNNTVGIVYIDLNPLIADNGLQQVGGWFPIYDTLKYRAARERGVSRRAGHCSRLGTRGRRAVRDRGQGHPRRAERRR